MTLIDLMQAFEKASIGVLNATEQAVWLRLALTWNRLRRPEWFSISRTEIMHGAGIGGEKRVDRARVGLEEKGFIATQTAGRTSPRKYHMKDLTKVIATLVTKDNMTLEQNPLGSLQPERIGQNDPSIGQNDPRLGSKQPPSQSTEIYTEYTESLSKDSNDIEIHHPPERETPSLPPDLLQYYMERFNPEPKAQEKEKLAIWAEQYTKEQVKEAIDAGAENGASHINYIGAILRNGGTTNGKPGRQRQAQRRLRQPTEEERRAKWDAEARKYGAGSYAHRGAAGVCGDQETVSEGDIPSY